MNAAYQRLGMLQRTLDTLRDEGAPDLVVTSPLVAEAIEVGQQHLQQDGAEAKKLFARDLLQRVAIDGQAVTIGLTLRKPGPKIAQVVAPRVGLEPTT